jgi:hypothetical protein
MAIKTTARASRTPWYQRAARITRRSGAVHFLCWVND